MIGSPFDDRGFTLIELSIVLVIIGLIVGGILVGQDLINGATIRAQITQIEKYNSAVNTFHSKYGGLPGDLALNLASQFGFPTDASCTGQVGGRDGNGLIDGWLSQNHILVQGQGETGLFFQDLSFARMIDGTYPNGGLPPAACSAGSTPILNASTMSEYFPPGKIGAGNFLTVYETYGANWYGLSALTSTTGPGAVTSNATITPLQAYNIDKKLDDGMPTTGKVQAVYLNGYSVIVNAANATPDSSTTCYNSTTFLYSTNVSSGLNQTCGLSFQFQ